jgi:hypothetical protein
MQKFCLNSEVGSSKSRCVLQFATNITVGESRGQPTQQIEYPSHEQQSAHHCWKDPYSDRQPADDHRAEGVEHTITQRDEVTDIDRADEGEHPHHEGYAHSDAQAPQST